jgi:serine/threonine-protein kinase SRPK3
MSEPHGTRLSSEEVELLADLLGKMLKYDPRDRIGIDEVVEHPWFQYELS